MFRKDFSLLEKPWQHVYNITIAFYMCLISPVSCVRLINGWQSVDRSQSRIACRDFLGLWLLKAPKKFVFLTDRVVQNFLAVEVKLNTRRKIESDLGNGMFSQLRTKIDNWKICQKAVFGHVRGNIYSFGKEKVKNWEFCEFCTFFQLEPYRALRIFFQQTVKPIISFYRLLLIKGLLRLFDKQNNTWLLVVMELLFS